MRESRWAFALKPFPNELLSSFLTRCAFAHGSTPYRFFHLYWPDQEIWNRDIDRDPNPDWLISVDCKVGLSSETLLSHSLVGLRFLLGGDRPSQGNTPLVLSAGIYHRTRKRHGLQYCPLCLSSNRPYFQMNWRLGFVVTCPRHKVRLLDACPECDRPVIPHRVNNLHPDHCYHCRFPLSLAPVSKAESLSVSLRRLESWLLLGLRVRSLKLADELHFSCDIFRLLRILLAVSTDRTTLARLRQAFDLPATYGPLPQHFQFEWGRVKDRCLWLEMLACWLSDWPYSFREGAKAARLTQRRFSRVNLPAFFEEEVWRMPFGFKRHHAFVPTLSTPVMKRLKRYDPFDYRAQRSALLLQRTEFADGAAGS